MKQFLFILLTILTLQSKAQDYSTINFLCWDVSIFINGQHISNLVAKESLQYKAYSEGRLEILFIRYGIRTIQTIDAKKGETYFFWGTIPTTKEKGNKYLSKYPITLTIEEDKNNPLIVSKTNSGPKQGTCFLISSDGYFITNFHCIENAKEITLKGIDGDFTTKYGATVVASDPSNDLALIKISNKNIKFTNPPFSIRSNGVAQAEKVYALGYPKAEAMGEEIKITEGIISAKSGVQGDISKFQISAAVNPGNSGGPLIDEEGNLIGVIYAKSNIADAAGYAIKASYLETFLKNVEGFKYPVLTNNLQDKALPKKVELLKNYIFIIETK